MLIHKKPLLDFFNADPQENRRTGTAIYAGEAPNQQFDRHNELIFVG